MADYFEQARLFDQARGIHRSLPIRDTFHTGLAHQSRCPLLRGLSDNDVQELKGRIYSVLDRLDSVGFMVNTMEKQIEDYRAFMKRVYAPGSGAFADPNHGEPVDFVVGWEDARSARFALEAVILFSTSLLEYLTRAVGLVFKRGNDRKILGLAEALRSTPSAEGLVDLFDEYKPLFQELQADGFRDRLRNVETGSGSYSGRKHRDVALHYQVLRISGLQLQIQADGSVDEKASLEPGAWSHLAGTRPAWGASGGILATCHELLFSLEDLVSRSVALLCTEVQETPDA